MKIEIKTHDGMTIFEEMEVYDEKAILDEINDTSNNNMMIALGKTIITKHTIRMIRPASENVVEETQEV